MKNSNITEHELKVKTSTGPGTLKLRQEGRRFTVLTLTLQGDEGLEFQGDRDDVVFGFDPKHATEVIDTSSDAYQCFNISATVKYGDVLLDNSEMRAHCIEDIKTALQRVKILPFNPEAI